ncbi:ABC transporter permease [Dyella sp.]|uniref:ABC transporter permease n=1 Tax=Dyella sp. TaxID=1869338 RepID=UPI002D78A0FF|nr:ABC transporter permease [Dyella sp.]HET7332320.1 ABC transporter permease [Dyella sp.]
MILALAVGIAAGMITIALRHALSMDPIPAKSELLMGLQDPSAGTYAENLFDYAHARALARLRGQNTASTFTGQGIVTSFSVRGRDISNSGGLGIRYATPSFFRMFNVPLERGRIWTATEEANATPVMVMSRDTAGALFPARDVIGQQVRLGHTLYTIIGITDEWNPRPRYYNLNGPAGAFGGDGDAIFLPVTTIQYAPDDMMVPRGCSSQATRASPSTFLTAGCDWLSVWYMARTQHDVAVLKQVMKNQLPSLFRPYRASKLQLLSVREILINANIVPGSVRLYSMLGVIFLALCVVNASGMQLSRVLRATSQIGIRRALGASRTEIIKQYLCDALLVGGAGGLLGVALTFAGLYGIRHLPGVFYADMARMDGAMFALMIALIFVCSVLVGVIPAWLASRADPALVIKSAQ